MADAAEVPRSDFLALQIGKILHALGAKELPVLPIAPATHDKNILTPPRQLKHRIGLHVGNDVDSLFLHGSAQANVLHHSRNQASMIEVIVGQSLLLEIGHFLGDHWGNNMAYMIM